MNPMYFFFSAKHVGTIEQVTMLNKKHFWQEVTGIEEAIQVLLCISNMYTMQSVHTTSSSKTHVVQIYAYCLQEWFVTRKEWLITVHSVEGAYLLVK